VSAQPLTVAAGPAALARAYLALTKPRIIELLLVTTVPPMILAGHALPSLGLTLATLVGGALTAGGANAVNCYVDRDIDAVMRRTSRRPLATAGSAVRPAHALAFGVLLAGAGAAVLVVWVNALAAVLALGAFLFYVFVYTMLLKRRTASNIVIGGAAGSVPVLVGWAAVTGTVGLPALALAAVVFLWTPPHFWALAVRFRDDYASVGVPMLPVVSTPAVVGRRILVYTYLTVAASLTLVPDAGVVYGIGAALVGGYFLIEAHRLQAALRRGASARPMRLFHASITYLTLLFAVLSVGAVLG
jgi:protoheme IX farnesyltransferase